MKGFMGAWLNHMINVRKKANHAVCKVLIELLEKSKMFKLGSFMNELSHDEVNRLISVRGLLANCGPDKTKKQFKCFYAVIAVYF